MPYTVQDRKIDPAVMPRPCEDAPGGTSTAAGYMAAAGMGIHEELCPFGAFVEEFPLSPEAEAIADAHGLWFRQVDIATGRPVPYARAFGVGRETRCEPCGRGDGHAYPDLNEMYRRGLLPTPYGCPVFGHDCPRYYGFEEDPCR